MECDAPSDFDEGEIVSRGWDNGILECDAPSDVSSVASSSEVYRDVISTKEKLYRGVGILECWNVGGLEDVVAFCKEVGRSLYIIITGFTL